MGQQQWLNDPMNWAQGLSNQQWSQYLGKNQYGGVPGGGGPAPSAPYLPIASGNQMAGMGPVGQMTVPQQMQGPQPPAFGNDAGLYGTGYLPMVAGRQQADPTGGPFPGQMTGMPQFQGPGTPGGPRLSGTGPFTAGLSPNMSADIMYALQHVNPTRLINQNQMDDFTKSRPGPLEGKNLNPHPASGGGGGAPAAPGAPEAPRPAAQASNPGWAVVGGKPVYVDRNSGQPLPAPPTSNAQQKQILATAQPLSPQAAANLKANIQAPDSYYRTKTNPWNPAILAGAGKL